MSVYPNGIDPYVSSAAGSTLDAANHTGLHNTLSEGMNKVQLMLGTTPTSPPTGEIEPASSNIRQRLLIAEAEIKKKQPIASVSVTPRNPGQAATVAWDAGTRVLTLGIPSGLPGNNGTNGLNGVSLVAASGIVTGVAALTPIKANTVVGVDVSFGKNLGFVPTVVCTPIQDTVGQAGGVTTTHTVASKAPSGTPPTSTTYASYQGDGVKRTGTAAQAGTLWHGYYDADNGHQHSMVVLGDLVPTLKDATITKVQLTIHTMDVNHAADQITVHQCNLTTIPATQLNSASSGKPYYVYKHALSEGNTFTFDLPASWHAGFKSGAIASLLFGPERNTADNTVTNAQAHFGAIHAQHTVVTIHYSLTSATVSTDVDSIPVDVGVRKVSQTGFRLIVRNSGVQNEKVRVSWMASP